MSAAPGPPRTPPGVKPTEDSGFDGLHRVNRETRTGGGSGAANEAELSSEELTEFARLLEDIAKLQREILIKIHAYQVAKETEKEPLLSEIKAKNKVVEERLSDSHLQALLTHLAGRNGEKDPIYVEVFGENGQLPFVLGTQDAIRAFLGPKDEQEPGNTSKPHQNRADEVTTQASPSPSPSPSPTIAASPAATASATPDGAHDGSHQGDQGRTQGEAGASASGTASGTVSGTASGTGSPGEASPRPAMVPLVANRYGVVPMVLTDAQIRDYMEPLIDQALVRENANRAGTGLVMNRNRQLVGATAGVAAAPAGSPDSDRYQAWLAADPVLKQQVLAHAQNVFDAALKAQQGGGSDPVSTSKNPTKP
jgi:hypothetical protein